MASRCELTGKGKQYGHNVSFSLRRTKRVFKPVAKKSQWYLAPKQFVLFAKKEFYRVQQKLNKKILHHGGFSLAELATIYLNHC